jgi:hypothetical protein
MNCNPSPAPEKEKKKLEITGWMAAVNIIISVGFFIFMYKFLPLLAATEMKRVNPLFGEQIVFNLVDGVIRIALFLLFIWGVSLWSDIHRVYEYHGAEHKTVYAFENGDPLETASVQKYSTFHPRCGTSFLMTVMLISIMVYILVSAVIPVTTFWAKFGMRIALLPVIAGVLVRDHPFRRPAPWIPVRPDDRAGPLAATHNHATAIRRPGRVRHHRAGPRHGPRKRARRRVSDRLAVPPANILSKLFQY